jgi:hypothetical protein
MPDQRRTERPRLEVNGRENGLPDHLGLVGSNRGVVHPCRPESTRSFLEEISHRRCMMMMLFENTLHASSMTRSTSIGVNRPTRYEIEGVASTLS